MTTSCHAIGERLLQRRCSWRLQRWHCARRPHCWPAAHGTLSRVGSPLPPPPTFREVTSRPAPGRGRYAGPSIAAERVKNNTEPRSW